MIMIIMGFAVTLVSCLGAFLSQLGFIGNEVSRLEKQLGDIKVHLDAGKGEQVTGKSLVNFTKRVFHQYKKLLKHRKIQKKGNCDEEYKCASQDANFMQNRAPSPWNSTIRKPIP